MIASNNGRASRRPTPFFLFPIIGLGLLGASALHASYSWGPAEAGYQLVMEYRSEAYVLDSDLTKDDCNEALPFGDQLKHVHFVCVAEG
ncbi:hypothetical protein GGR40_000332 [Novosphingobium gossypii]